MRNYDMFFEKPGEITEKTCLVCGSTCEVKRGQLGPTSWIGAVSHRAVLHDYFYCPHADQVWHQQALELVLAIENTPSKRLAELMKLDLEDLLRENLPGYK